MLNIDEIRKRAKMAIDEEFPDGPVYGNAAYYCVTGDVPALCDEVERLRAENEQIRAERDEAIKDIMCKDHCDVCTSGREINNECQNADYDCLACKSKTCRCRDCRDENKWEWRGIQRAREETEK